MPFARLLGFVPLPLAFYGWMSVIVVAYIASAEIVKRWFYSKIMNQA
jgi:Mg2+-importing ATPase